MFAARKRPAATNEVNDFTFETKKGKEEELSRSN